MKVLVLWADDRSTNLGVRVLASGTAEVVRRVWPDAEVSFLSWGNSQAPMRVGSWKALVRERVQNRNGLKAWIRRYDLVVDTRAGDSFADIYGVPRLVSMSGLAEFIHHARVPLVLGPQTVGPFNTRRGRLIARRSLSTANLVMSRDAASTAAAQRLGRRVDAQTTDVVFALPKPRPTATHDVLLNVSGLLWAPNPHVDHEEYQCVMESLCGRLAAAGRRVTLLAHVLDSSLVDNDVPAVRDLAARCGGELDVVVPESLDHARSAVAAAEVVIGSRMHACLNALSVGTPAVALAYSRKFEPLLADIGWSRTVDLRSHPDPVSAAMTAIDAPDLAVATQKTLDRAHELLEVGVESLRSLA